MRTPVAVFQDLGGLLARAGSIVKAQQAVIQAGFRSVGSRNNGAYGFTQADVLYNVKGLQVELSNPPGVLKMRGATRSFQLKVDKSR